MSSPHIPALAYVLLGAGLLADWIGSRFFRPYLRLVHWLMTVLFLAGVAIMLRALWPSIPPAWIAQAQATASRIWTVGILPHLPSWLQARL